RPPPPRSPPFPYTTLFRSVLVMLPALELDLRGALPRARPRDQLGEPAVAVRPDHQIDLRHPLEQPRPETLRHAADHAQHVAPALDRKSTRLNSSHVSISYA